MEQYNLALTSPSSNLIKKKYHRKWMLYTWFSKGMSRQKDCCPCLRRLKHKHIIVLYSLIKNKLAYKIIKIKCFVFGGGNIGWVLHSMWTLVVFCKAGKLLLSQVRHQSNAQECSRQFDTKISLKFTQKVKVWRKMLVEMMQQQFVVVFFFN